MHSTSKPIDKSTAIAVTAVLHIIILLLLLFLAMPDIKVDPPLPLPIELEAAGSSGGGGGGSPAQTSPPRPVSSSENMMTAAQGTDSRASGQSPVPTQSHTPNNAATETQTSINSNALMRRSSSSSNGSGSSSGSGIGSGAGNGSGAGSGSGGGNGIGRSSGNGINLHGLDGRGFREKPGAISKDALAEEGKLVVRVRVDKDGNVREAVTEGFKIPEGIPKTTITDPDQKNLARREALKYKFTAKQGALDEFGYLVFDFKFRN